MEVLTKQVIPLLFFNISIYYLFTTAAIRRKHYRKIRILFYYSHKYSYLDMARNGSSYFLVALNSIFGVVDKETPFFSKSYFSQKMISRTYLISFAYISLSIIYFDYILNERYVSLNYPDVIINMIPYTGIRDYILNNQWMHILIAVFMLWPITLTALLLFLLIKKLNKKLLTLALLLFTFFSYQWLGDHNNTTAPVDFESPIFMVMQFIVHGSERFEALLGDIYLLLLLFLFVRVLGMFWGTAGVIISFFLVSFRLVAYYGINEGYSSSNFAFWFDRIVGSISRSSILFLAPLLNFIVDSISINISRFLFLKLQNTYSWFGFVKIIGYDILFALAAFISTPVIFLAIAYIIDFIDIWEFGENKIFILLIQEYTNFFTGKGDSRTWWIWVMLFSTILPSVIHALFVFFEIFVKLIEPVFRNSFKRGHLIISEKKSSEDIPFLKIKNNGEYKVILLISLLMLVIELAVYKLLPLLQQLIE